MLSSAELFLKELFDVGPAEDTEYPNRWPPEDAIPGFRSYMQTTFRKFEKLNAEVLDALELGMQLPPGTFTKRCTQAASEFRFVNYPALSAADVQNGKITRAWPHYDIGVLSFLFQDNVGGLEICDGSSKDAFVPVVSETLTDLVVNVGETLHRWTNGIIKGGLHRVTTAPSIAAPDGQEIPQRRSVVFFAKADRTVSVAPLPALLDDDHAANFDDLTFLEYHQQRIATAY
jgi:isopenicillin N synthase-like dioxygenase